MAAVSLRLFVAVHLGEAVTAALGETIAAVHDLAPRARWVPPANAHLTLAFLGRVDASTLGTIEAAVRETAARHAPFRLRVRGAGTFGGRRHPRVLWLGVDGDVTALGHLQRDLDQRLRMRMPPGPGGDARAFRPHLTLARARGEGDAMLAASAAALAPADLGEAVVEDLRLYRSDLTPAGARHHVLLAAPLSAIRDL